MHAGNREEGLIDRCDLVFLAKAKDGDYHQEMNVLTFLNWLENQLMPALKSPSVIVLDNASYHNIKTEETVVSNFNQVSYIIYHYCLRYDRGVVCLIEVDCIAYRYCLRNHRGVICLIEVD